MSNLYLDHRGVQLMLSAWLVGLCAALAGETPAPEGRDLYRLVDPAFEGNGPGGGVFVDARQLGAKDSSLGGVAIAGWTFRPLRLAVAFPGEATPDYVAGETPRLDALFVLSDRRRGGLGVAASIDAPLPFVPTHDPQTRARLALGVGRANTAVVVNLGAPVGPPLKAVDWSIGGATPLWGPLSGFAELEGIVALDLVRPGVGFPIPDTLRVGLHLSPFRPIVIGVAVEGHPANPHPSFTSGVVWIPQPKPKRPRTDGLDSDRDGVGDAVDACPREKEDMDGDNDADGCPDPDENQAADAR